MPAPYPCAMPKVCPVCEASFPDATMFCPTDGSTLRAAEVDGDLIGSVIADRYLVTDLLGEGGMGKVYLARHVRLPQQAAIKVLRPAMLRDPAAVARFKREAANASRIEHERIARVFDFGESSDGTVYLAMEFVPGRTLKRIITADGALTPERASTITRQISEALDAAHRLGIVHRDLKPDNVMVIEDAEVGDRCKVVDFGIAKAVGGDAGEAGLTKTGFIVGTPEFMSPEQLLGENVDHRSDVYALALLAFQCLTGALPFDSTTPERAMTARLVEKPRTLDAVHPRTAWPASVQAVFDRGLAKSAADRYPSAGAFAKDLASAIASWNAGPASAPSAPPAEAKPLSSPVASSAIAGGAPYSSPATSGKTEENSTSNKTSKSQLPLIGGGIAAIVGIAALVFVLTRPDATNQNDTVSQPAEMPSGSEAIAPQVISQGQDTDQIQAPVGDTQEPQLELNKDRETANAAAGSASGNQANVGSQPRTSGASADTPQAGSSSSSTASTATGSTESNAAARARVTLDSIRRAIDPLTATPAQAREGVAALRVLMPRLGSAEDSAWAFLRQAEAHFIMNDARSACVALKAARPLLRTAGQRDIMALMSGSISDDC